MPLSKYLILMSLATLLCWASFIIVINTVNPFNTEFLGFVFFYSSLFLALIGTLSLLGFFLRHLFNKNQFVSTQVIISFRQSIWLAVVIVVGLYLQGQKLAAWWNLFILLILVVVVELYFLYRTSDVNDSEQ